MVTSKLGEHPPPYRLEKIFKRHAVDITRSSMHGWILCASELIAPLVELISPHG